MRNQAAKALMTVVLAVTASTFIGFGTNAFIGAGVFFTLWTIAGLLELNE